MNTGNIDPRLVNVLKEISGLAEDATLTGRLSDGAPQAVRRYNSLLSQFVSSGAVPVGLFQPVRDDAQFAEVGVESRLLAAFLEGDSNGNGHGHRRKDKEQSNVDASVLIRLAPFVRGEDLSELVAEYVQKGVQLDTHILTSLAPFLDSGSLGKLMRKHLENLRPSEPEQPSQPQPASAPSPSPSPESVRDLVPSGELARADPLLEDLAARLQDSDVSVEEIREIALQLAKYAHP